MQPNLLPWIGGLWITFVLIWIFASTKTKREARRQSGRSRFVQAGLLAAGAILLFGHGLNIGLLGSRFLPDTAPYAYAGVAITACGLAFAVWARFVLGQNWSGRVTLKQGHELVRLIAS